MTETLSLWRSPLDSIALSHAQSISAREPRCSIGYGEDLSAMTIYNYSFYIDIPKDPNDALTQMLGTMTSASPVGGAAFIPQQEFSVTASASGFSVPDQCNIVGSGGGGSGSPIAFFHFLIGFPGADLLFLNCAAGGTGGGVYFRSLAFRATTPHKGDTCIYAATWNCQAVSCTFTDVPTAFNAVGPSCALMGCTVDYANGPNNATAIVIGGSNCAVVGPSELRQLSQNSESGGPTGCTCISILGSSNHALLSDLHVSDWTLGVDFSQGAGSQHTQIMNCEMQCWTSAARIELPANAEGAYTAGIKITSCTLAKTNDNTDPTSCVVIDAMLTAGFGNTNAQLSDVTLLDCTVYNQAQSIASGQHGLEIRGGQNIKVIGGTYSNNSSVQGAGIAITGDAGDVQIVGANLQPSYDNGKSTSFVNMQQYGLMISGSPAGVVLISGCDMRYYFAPAKPVEVTGSPNKLLIYDCMGYNDQSTALNSSLAPTANVNAASCSTPYFGPSVITFANPTPVTLYIFGQIFQLSFGVIFVASPYDGFYFQSVPAYFSWIGQ